MQELNYIRCEDYCIPDIYLPEKNRPIGQLGCAKNISGGTTHLSAV